MWQEAQDARCGGCGHPRSETMDPDGPAYEVSALRCRACEAKAAIEAQWRRDESSSLGGIFFATNERSE